VSGGGAIYVNLLGFQISTTKVNFEIFFEKFLKGQRLFYIKMCGTIYIYNYPQLVTYDLIPLFPTRTPSYRGAVIPNI